MFPEWVSLLQWPLHPSTLVLWWRSWLFWQLWWTPLLQWVPDISFSPPKRACGLPLSAVCVCVSVPSASVCWCEKVTWVLKQRVWVSGVFLCVGAVVSQASYCKLHSLVVTPLSIFWHAAPPPPFVHQWLQSLTLAFVWGAAHAGQWGPRFPSLFWKFCHFLFVIWKMPSVNVI